MNRLYINKDGILIKILEKRENTHNKVHNNEKFIVNDDLMLEEK